MKNTRRDFFKLAAGLPLLAQAALVYGDENRLRDDVDETSLIMKGRKSVFNMSGYAAPAIPTLRVGYIGLGPRGFASLKRTAMFEDVEIRAIADCYEYPIQQARDFFKSIGYPAPAEYYASEETWKDLVARDDLDLIFIATPQYWHAEMALAAMEAGKHVACEVPLAYTLEDCWKLVETSERTKKHLALLENCCYDFFEATTANMARQGVFGDIIYGEGAYIHYFPSDQVFAESQPPIAQKAGMYRHAVACTVPGNRYPTHGIGPVCAAMNIGAGDRPDYLTSTETDDFVRARDIERIWKESGSDYHKQFLGKPFTGNMNLSVIRTAKGKAITVKYDRMDPQPYSRIYQLSGLKGMARKYPEPARIYLNGETAATEEEMKALEEQYAPELVKYLRDNALEFGGHGGMDFICEYRLFDNLRNGLPLDINVYHGVTWSAVIPLSLWSATHRSQPIDFPDFTGGTWETNQPMDFSLRGGGSTKVKSPTEASDYSV